MLVPSEILEKTVRTGIAKTHKTLVEKLVLGFLGGALIAIGYLAHIRVSASISVELSGMGSLLGAAIFPIGLILILLGGGELVTGNMTVVGTAWLSKKISLGALVKNLLVITLANLIGALFVAYILGHLTGLTSTGVYADTVARVAQAKVAATPLQAFISGIGCNWLVGLSIWLCYGAQDASGKILAIWFPVMTFVAIGFQHSVANMFIVPAAIFIGQATWLQFLTNLIPVYFGNIIGGLIFVGLFYVLAYGRHSQVE